MENLVHGKFEVSCLAVSILGVLCHVANDLLHDPLESLAFTFRSLFFSLSLSLPTLSVRSHLPALIASTYLWSGRGT